MMQIKPQVHPFQPAVQLRTRNNVEVQVRHFGKPVEYRFVILFQESWMIKLFTGSQEVQQLWQTEARFST